MWLEVLSVVGGVKCGCRCSAGILVVCECLSVLLQSILMSYVDCGDDGYVVR